MSELRWHPMIVHFPLALVLTSTACFLASRIVRRASVAHSLGIVGTWNFCLGAVSAVFAIGSGLLAASHAPQSPDATASVTAHLSWAVASGLIVLALAIFRGAGIGATSRPKVLFLILLGLASAGLITTGFYGGENVFRYGIGVHGHSN